MRRALGAAALLLLYGSSNAQLGADHQDEDHLSLVQVMSARASWRSPQVVADSVDQGRIGEKHTPPQFTVDLGKPPQERWVELGYFYRDFFRAESDQTYDTLNETTRARVIDAFWSAMGLEYQQELIGYMRAAGFSGDELMEKVRNVTLGLMQYELGSSVGCSGVLATDMHGTVFHGRNMDYFGSFIYPDGRRLYWTDLTSEVTFVKDGTPVAKWISWPGGIFPHTAVKFGMFSVEQNTRHFEDKFDNVDAMLNHGGLPYVLLARRAMDQATDFQSAVDMLWQGNLMAPSYFVVAGAGPYEGAVLTMDRNGQHLGRSPPMQKLSSKGPYSLAQMNSDKYDAQSWIDPRYPVADFMLKFENRSRMSVTHMLDFMRRPPITNGLTIFTFVNSPATNETLLVVNPENGQSTP